MNFFCGGHLGDGVLQLYTSFKYHKLTGKRSLFVIGPGQSIRWGESEMESLLALASMQPYIDDTFISTGPIKDSWNHHAAVGGREEEEHYEWNSEQWPGNVNLKKRYFSRFMIGCLKYSVNDVHNLFDRSEPWLNVDKFHGAEVIFHIPSHRMTRSRMRWADIVKRVSAKCRVRIIVSKDEIRDWKGYGVDNYLVMPINLYDAARMINGAKVFSGIASCNYLIAEGLDIFRLVDVPLESIGTQPHNERGWNSIFWPDELLVKRILTRIE